MTYHLDGSPNTQTDQRGVVHTYQYDTNRRVELDRITSFGSSGIVDDTVKSIGRSYDTLGRTTAVTSYSTNNGSGTPVNQLAYTYDGTYGTLTKTEQEHEGAVDGSTPSVQYGYDTTTSSNIFTNALRRKSTTYPNGRIVHETYGAANSIADRLSRVDMLAEDASGSPGTDLTAYTYAGTSRLVSSDLKPIEVKLDLHQGGSGNDRFGRTVDHLWDDYGSGSPPDISRIKHGYDYAGNRTWREDVMAAANAEHHDEFYMHDGLHRLKNFDRGDLNVGKTAISGTPGVEQDFSLDQLGNWENLLTKTSGSTTLDQDRAHNAANETGTIDVWQNPAHDAAGNMTTIPRPKAPASGYTAKYDAWNRLVSLEDGNGVVEVNEYDGLHRRIVRDDTGGSYSQKSWIGVPIRRRLLGG